MTHLSEWIGVDSVRFERGRTPFASDESRSGSADVAGISTNANTMLRFAPSLLGESI